MAPAYDEFQEKADRRRRSSSDAHAVRLLPRIRRNRRTTTCIIAVVVLGLYYILKISTTGWLGSPLDFDPYNDDLYPDEFAPYYQYHPVLGSGDNRGSGEEIPRIRFPYLYSSLSTSSAAGLRSWNQNVLFVATDVKAAKRLAVTACEMSKFERVQVHFALVGDSSINVDDFQSFSRIAVAGQEDDDGGSDCRITFHDGTTMTQLTVPLLGKAVGYALLHLHRFLHPQVMFVDTENESKVVANAIKDTAGQLGLTIVELPRNAAENLRWMARLSSQSLRAWNRPKVEIFIRCDKHHGNLERLLKSLRNADYFGITPTRLTIEVGTSSPLHPFTQQFIENFNWPSRDRIGIRYSMFPPEEDPISQAIHHVESFYPADRDTSILFLDPNVELSPYYFHWLHYATLEYVYSGYPFNAEPDELYGISLTSPKTFINGSGPWKIDGGEEEGGPFLYVAPEMQATLVFPEPWKKFWMYFQWRMKGIREKEKREEKAEVESKTQEAGNNEKKTSTPTSEGNDPGLLLGATHKNKNKEEELLTGATKLNRRDQQPPPPPSTRPRSGRNFTFPNITPSSEFSSSWLLYLAEFAQIQGSIMLYPHFLLSDSPDSPDSPSTIPTDNSDHKIDNPKITKVPPIPLALAISHTERPLRADYKLGKNKNPGQDEPRLINSMTITEGLPGWRIPLWQDFGIVRGLEGGRFTGLELEAESRKYKSQIISNGDGDGNDCENQDGDLVPGIKELLCS